MLQDQVKLLPYQWQWVNDHSRFKLWEKSRRIGATWCQAYEDMIDASRADNPMDVWFSSADLSAATEYIRYVVEWASLAEAVAEPMGEIVLDDKAGIRALGVQFANGKRIYGLSSNPKAFRSKGGKLVLDEFAFHGDADALWKAAMPVITHGFPVRVISTHNGRGNRFYRLISGEADQGQLWSKHRTTIKDAVAQGLVGIFSDQPVDQAKRDQFIAQCWAAAGDDDTFAQEYIACPVDEATAWLPWSTITACENEDAGKPENYQGGDTFIGMDIGRRRDLTVIWIIEQVGDVYITREVVSFKNTSFAQ